MLHKGVIAQMSRSLRESSIRRFAIAVLLFAVTAAVSMAQTGSTGAIAGVITDPAGSVVPQADIKVTNTETGETRTTTSQTNGAYIVPLLPPGLYRVDVSKSGFKLSSYPNIRVNVTETETLNARLEVGALTEQITVAAEAEQLQTETSVLGRVTNEEMVVNLPLVTRNYTQIIGLNAGVSADVTNATELGRGSGGLSNFSAGGVHIKDNNYQMDGVSTNDIQNSGSFSGGVAIPNPDTIQEFKVQVGQYDATYGKNAGANVNVVTKGGTNAFHGTVFEFFRNEKLNANDFFFNRAGQKRPLLRQNQYGGTLGGPVVKDKLFFFVSYQGTKQLNGVSGQCSSSYTMVPLTNDRSRTALGRLFAGQRGAQQVALGNVGPAISADGSNISAPAFALLNLKLPNGQYAIPSPQRIDPSQPFSSQGSSVYSSACTFNEDQFMTNADYLPSAKSRLAFRFFWANSDQTITFPPTNLGGATAPGWPWLNPNKFRNVSLTHTYVFNPTLLNEFEIAYHRQWAFTFQTEPVKYSDFGVNAPAYDDGIPAINFQGAAPTLGGNGQTLLNIQNAYILQDSLAYTRGRHTFRFGGGVERLDNNLQQFHYIAGLVFLSFPDFLLGLNATQSGTAGAGVPVGNIFQSVDLPGLFDRSWRVWNADWFVQDDIKVSRRLTLNVGFRYERLGNFAEQLGRNSDFDYSKANQNPPAAGSLQGYTVPSNYKGTIPDGVTKVGSTTGLNDVGQNTWNPRLGLAWQLPGTDRLVLRGGYGIYHSRTTGQPFIQLLTAPPFAVLTSLASTQNGAATLANPFPPAVTIPVFPPYSPTTSRTLTIIDLNSRPPMLQRYSMGLQTKLARDLVLEVGYSGSRGTHLLRSRSVNQALLASAASPIRGVTTNTVANIPLRVPYQGFTSSGLTDIEPSGANWYSALDVSLEKRFNHGLQFLASYTFARLLATDSFSSSGANGGSATGNQNDPRQRYGPDNFVRDQRFVLSAVYALPWLRNSRSFMGEVLGGWQLSGVTTVQTGRRITITQTNSANVFGISSDRAQLAPGCTYPQLVTSGSIQSRLTNYFNKSCFMSLFPIVGDDNRATTFGNAGVGIVRGPDQANLDLSVLKQFPIPAWTDRMRLEFRAEFFNALNHPQFGDPTASFTSASFGRILTTSVNPRVIQFALKLGF
jgi:hypothetical protein